MHLCSAPAPKLSRLWVTKTVVKKGHFQPMFGPIVLKVQDIRWCANLVLPYRVGLNICLCVFLPLESPKNG